VGIVGHEGAIPFHGGGPADRPGQTGKKRKQGAGGRAQRERVGEF